MPASISGLETKFRKSGTGSRKKGMAIRIMLRSHFALNCKKYNLCIMCQKMDIKHPDKDITKTKLSNISIISQEVSFII